MANENGESDGLTADGAGRTVEQERDELANSLRFEQEKNKELLGQAIALEDELLNRLMAEFGSVMSNATRDFWREQLLTNREAATVALQELAQAKAGGGGTAAGGVQAQGAGAEPRGPGVQPPAPGTGRRPLHNRALSRPVAPTEVGGGGAPGGGSEDRAVRLRNRAHELVAAEGVPFQSAFRRAEREFAAQG